MTAPFLLLCLGALPAAAQPAGPGSALPAEAASPAGAQWTPQAVDELRQAIAQAGAHGLDPKSFEIPVEASASELDAIALRYAGVLARGVVDPAQLHEIYTLPRPNPDLRAQLRSALAEGRVGAWLGSLAPQTADYQALSAAYLAARATIGQGEAAAIPEGPLLRPGGRDPRTPAIAAALAAAGEIKPRAARDALVYDARLSAAVRRIQAEHGLRADGVIGPDTLSALNAGPTLRARRLAVNLERLRWLERTPPDTRIDVNIASAELRLYRTGEVVDTRRVVVGAPGHETPWLQANFSRIVVNPPWNVPQSIAQAEILPKGSGYLARNDMYVRDGRVVQRPGPKSALGLVKFDLDDPYAIYLHDTPSKALFSSNRRHSSHGCVRVQDAVEFARELAAERGEDAAFQAKLDAGDTSALDLGAEIPVRLLYLTAEVQDGAVKLHPDVYGWDDALSQALGLGGLNPEGPARAAILLGP